MHRLPTSVHRRLRKVAVISNGAKPQHAVERYCRAAQASIGAIGGSIVRYTSSSPPDVEAQTRRAIDDGHRVIVAAGGDGTLLAVLQAVRESRVVVTVLPLGTSNDYARSLGIGSFDQALGALTAGEVREVDLGTCSYEGLDGAPRESVFCLSAGLGFTAELARSEASRLMPRLKGLFGNGAFKLASAHLLGRYRASRAELVLNGRRLEVPVALLEVSKVTHLGGQPLTPHARPDNGFLDMCLFEGAFLRRWQLLLGLQLSDRHIAWRDYEYFCDEPACNSFGLSGLTDIGIRPAQRMPLHLHGEFVGYGPARFQVLPRSLRVLVPPSPTRPLP